MHPKTFKKLIDNFSSLPSIGPKMAERLVLHLFKQNNDVLDDFSSNIIAIKGLRNCKRCFNISEGDLCEICSDTNRNQTAICVVEDSLDIFSIERTRTYRGLYHSLGGVMESSSKKQDTLRIPELLRRIQNENITEVILATNPTTEGDLTALYLKKKLSEIKEIKITRLARGLSTGGDIEYADELTLAGALTNRREI